MSPPEDKDMAQVLHHLPRITAGSKHVNRNDERNGFILLEFENDTRAVAVVLRLGWYRELFIINISDSCMEEMTQDPFPFVDGGVISMLETVTSIPQGSC